MDDDDMISLETKPPAGDHEEEEAVLSLCDFPLITSDNASADDQDHHNPPSQPSDFFEFFNDLNSENIIYSHAEDIISCGKLVPYKLRQKPLFDEQILKSVESGYDDVNIRDYSSRRYCESSLPERAMIRSNSGSNIITRLTRTSRSLDSRNLRRNSSLLKKYPDASPEMHRSFSLKPRRYAFMFGLLKFPSPEMDLQDMKNRQVRRSHVLAAVEGGGANNKRSDRRNSWGDGLLRVLSCKKDASVAVTPSINGLVP